MQIFGGKLGLVAVRKSLLPWADPGENARGVRAPPGPNSFIFMQFPAKKNAR